MAARLTDEKPASGTLNEDDVRRALDRVLASRHFIHAPMKRKFLRLICDFYMNGRAAELNEYLIGREVFERNDTYNPAADPIVRVGAHDLRKKLELYYNSEGAQDEIRLDIPIGSYEPVFVRRIIETVEPPALSISEPVVSIPAVIPRTNNRSLFVAVGLAALLLAVVILLLVSNRALQHQLADANLLRDGTEYGAVWEPFLKASDQTLLVISNPPVYRFSNSIDPDVVIKRSVGLSEENANNLVNALKDKFVMKHNRIPRLVLSPEDYTGMGEAIGLYRITDLFRSTGKGILLKQSRTATAEDLKNHNVILLGSVWANEWSGRLPIEEDFVYSGNATIENRRPMSGESAEYRPEFNLNSGDLISDYALVTVKPNISYEDTVMVLAGVLSEGTEAAVEYVTSKNYLNDLNQRLHEIGGTSGPPRYYQALLHVGVENGIPTTVSLVALHELRVTRE